MIKNLPSGAAEPRPRITIVGVGGAGANAVANMIASDLVGVEYVVANSDAQALKGSDAAQRIQLGRCTTEGLGAGSDPGIGKAAAEESLDEIEAGLEGSHMCFIAAGMGGGTGTGAAPVIARAAREKGILTVGVVTKPFAFEGSRRARVAEAGIEELSKHVDTLIIIPNQNLFRIADVGTTFRQAFAMADDVLQQGVRGIADLMTMPGLVNLDFADVRTVMNGGGKAMMGTGEASGDDRARQAAEMAISNPLLDGAMKGARGVIISITGDADMRLMEIDEVANYIKDLVDPEADIIWGSAIDPGLDGRLRVSIVATGLEPEVEPPCVAVPAAIVLPPISKAAPKPVALPLAPAAVPLPVALPSLADLFDLPAAVAEPEAELLLCERAPIPRGPSLFERVADMARRGANAGLEMAGGPEEAFGGGGVYDRRWAGGRY